MRGRTATVLDIDDIGDTVSVHYTWDDDGTEGSVIVAGDDAEHMDTGDIIEPEQLELKQL